jgi:2-haloacid dehalogenase
MPPVITGVEACVFDAYGTLFDVHSPVARLAQRLGPGAQEFSRLWRQKQLEYTWLRSLMHEHADFWQVTGDALDYSLQQFAIEDGNLRDELMQLYLTLDAYEDAHQCLSALSGRGMRTAILSNGTPHMLAQAAESARLTNVLDEIVSVEEVGVFKPDPRVYARALDRLRIGRRSAIFFVSANPWDAQAAAHFGFQVARIDRLGLKDEKIPGRPTLMLKSLAEIPAILV